MQPDVLARAVATWDAGDVRPADAGDAIDESVPAVVLEPADATMVAEMLRWAHRDRIAMVPRGGGTKLLGPASSSAAYAVLSTRRLTSPMDHCAGDLTATIGAGVPLASANAAMALSGQQLPLDPPYGDRATIGGIVAANDSGPRRHRHGSPRDLILGIEMVRADGQAAKAGGRVVKNVAGYDLARMMCGSFGSLAVITSATFKLAPLAEASCTVVATAPDAETVGRLALALAAAPLSPSAIELVAPHPRLLVRFETTARAVDHQGAAAAELCRRHGAEPQIYQGPAETDVWRDYERAIWKRPVGGMIVKTSVLPADVGSTIECIEAAAARAAARWTVAGRAAMGVLYLRVEADEAGRLALLLDELRRHVSARRGSAVVVAASRAVRSRIDCWGDIGSALPVMRTVKARFDPTGVLNPGGGPANL